MSAVPEIVGIMLVRNEERFVERALLNSLGFCDRLLIADHRSTDDTWPILSRLAADHCKIELHRIDEPSESHDLIRGLAGSRTWIFGVDGDEIYDPRGLAQFRLRVLSGEFDGAWQVFGNVLNCTALDESAGTAEGYLAPPSRSMTKLFNFHAIDSWQGSVPERLHGGEIAFRDGYRESSRDFVMHRYQWEDSPFRCLHLCFIPRSRRDTASRPRRNIMELGGRGRWSRLLGRLGLDRRGSDYKRDKYRRGELVCKQVGAFLEPGVDAVR